MSHKHTIIQAAAAYFKPLMLATALLSPVAIHAAGTEPSYPLIWQARPQLQSLQDDWKKYSAVIMLDERRIEFKLGEDKNYYVYRSFHRRIRLLDDKGVESFNKFTVYGNAEREISNIKARTILPGGRIIELKEADIKTSKSEGGADQYLFAMNGVEKGAEVEMMYTEKKPFGLFSSETFQTAIPVSEASFSMIVPAHLQYEFGGYNGFPKPQDSTVGELHFYHCATRNLPAVEEEDYSNADASLQRVDYKLSYVQGNQSEVRRFTWSELAKQIYSKYETFTDKERRIAAKYLESIHLNTSDEELKKIQKIEDALKTNITTSEDITDEKQEEFEKIVDKKLTTDHGLARFMAACFTEAGIKYEFGLSSSRYNYMLDESLEIWTMLTQYVFYFPNQRMFLAPAATGHRAPMIPYGLMGNKGIFAKVTTIGTLVSALPDIRTINVSDMSQSVSGIEASVQFSKTEMTPEIALTHFYNGHPAVNLRAAFTYVARDKEKELVQGITGLEPKLSDIKDYTIEEKAFNATLPLKMNVNLEAPQLMEKAGTKYLFSVGKLLGRQSEMYQDEKRKLPLEINYPHSLPRTILITIPQGYKIINPEAVRLDVTDKAGSAVATLAFHSDYKINGNVMEITVNESYSKLTYPITDYAVFRNVVNAAADFTKIVLVLEKI